MASTVEYATTAMKSSWPPFLDLLERDPDRAWEGFYEFVERLMRASPPRKLRQFPAQDHQDMIHEFIVHCCKDSFRVLRKYRNLGKPFAAWLLHVANNFLLDRLEVLPPDPVDPRPSTQEDETERLIELIPDPRRGPDWAAIIRQYRALIVRCLAEMSIECQILIRAALIDGRKPREILLLMGLPKDTNKSLSDRIRNCRYGLARRLIDGGLDPRWFVGPRRVEAES